jgi:hypothetical protein
MKHSEQPRIELAKAKACIDGLRNARSLDEFEEHWKNFLHKLERVWNKTCNHYSKSPKWNGWKGKYEQLRKKDPLLSYLVNARGADEHTVNEITSRKPGSIGINPAEGNSLYIEKMTIKTDHVSINSPQKISVDFIPARTVLADVISRGRTYPVPTSHRGKPVDPANVTDIAETAVEFYKEFLDEVEAYFVK